MIQVTGNDRVELESYQLKDAAHIWYTQWEKIGIQMQLLLLGIALVRPFWIVFSPIELREAKTHEFMNLRQGNMMFKEYGLKFNHSLGMLLIWLLTRVLR